MTILLKRLVAVLATTLFVGVCCADDEVDEAEKEFFEKKIRPVLVENCYRCHSKKSDDLKGNLYVDTKEGLREGGDTGPAVVEGDTEQSLILTALKYEEDAFQMPPDGKLSDEIIADFETWIENGAWDPRSESVERVDPRQRRAAEHWSFQRPQSGALPVGYATRIDGWIERKLTDKKTTASPQSPRPNLARRVYYDLTGLPPTYTELSEFLNDESPLAYDRLVDRLIASPRFGERWARMWLDVSRYSDTKGYVFQEDRSYPDAYTFRQWVIEAWNADLAYDQFLQYQLAADQLPQLSFRVDSRAAMGFLTLGRRFLNNTHDIVDDRIDVTTRGMMGLTVSCARCHDHKYDAIPASDYYSMYGVFANSVEPKNAPAPLRLEDSGNIREPYVFLRGKPGNRGPRVTRKFLTVLAGSDAKPFTKGSGRLELAAAIADRDNPLTARVLVNRVWARLFGDPLVGTPSDFGVRCETPLQQDLLDDLSARFMENDWSIKRLIREVVRSDAYRRSTKIHSSAKWDTENQYLSRQNIRRRDFEGTWDAILAQSNDLDFTVGGPSEQLHVSSFGHRRGIYAYIDRQNLPGMFRTFDLASPDAHAPRRYETTSPQQALFLINSPFVLSQSRRISQWTARQDGASQDVASQDVAARIQSLYRMVLSRQPAEDEMNACLEFIKSETERDRKGARINRWSYGYGPYDAETGRVSSFTALPSFSDNVWQGGAKLPDSELGYASLRPRGGHPGDKQRAVVRRLHILQECELTFDGFLEHPAKQGDGVRLTVYCHQNSVVGSWVATHGKTEFVTKTIEVAAGGTVDLIIDMRESLNHDSFNLEFTANEFAAGRTRPLNSVSSFGGPTMAPLDAWGRLAQVLLLSNELLFVE
jgi:hypothetical protein